MTSALFSLIHLTILETRRSKTILALLLVYLLLLATSVLIASVTMGETIDIVVDFGFSSMSILGILVGLILSVQLTRQDTEQRSVYLLVPRLPSRLLYAAGKFSGIALTITGAIAVMSIMLAITLFTLKWQHWLIFLQACCFTMLESWLAIAIGLLFAYTSSLFLSIFLSFTTVLAGHFSYVIKLFGNTLGGIMEHLINAAYYLLPNFEIINLRNRILEIPVLPWVDFFYAGLYVLTELCFILCIATIIFLQKDLQNK